MNKTRFNYIGLSSTDKSTLPDFAEHDVDGTTFLEVDTSKVYVRYNSTWYELGA